jgi:formyltetrahydrofolate-dependent phosphoribosylglycinamide formyltransferase
LVPKTQKKIKIAVGVSGSGRSLLNLIENQRSGNFSVSLVFSSTPAAGANKIADRFGIPLVVFDFSNDHREQTKAALYGALEGHDIDLVVLAGFLKLLPLDRNWQNKIINIHPSLLPKFGGKGMHGLRVHQEVVGSGELTTGATVHFVNEKYDEGQLLAQVRVPITHEDSPEVVGQKVFQAECRLLPAVIAAIAGGRLPSRGIAQLNNQGEFIEPI